MHASSAGLTAEVGPGPHAQLVLAGHLHAGNAWLLRESLRSLRQESATICLDLSEVTAIDRPGVDVLVGEIHHATLSGTPVLVEPVSAAVTTAVPMIRLWGPRPG